MWLEALILSACLQNAHYSSPNDGCPTSLQAYALTETDLVQGVREGERNIRKNSYADKTITYVLVPTYTALAANRLHVPMTRRWAVDYVRPNQSMVLAYTFNF